MKANTNNPIRLLHKGAVCSVSIVLAIQAFKENTQMREPLIFVLKWGSQVGRVTIIRLYGLLPLKASVSTVSAGFPQALEIMENQPKKVPCMENSWNLKKNN